jgi:hypothetical protein
MTVLTGGLRYGEIGGKCIVRYSQGSPLGRAPAIAGERADVAGKNALQSILRILLDTHFMQIRDFYAIFPLLLGSSVKKPKKI